MSADRTHLYAACTAAIPVTPAGKTVEAMCPVRSDALSAAIRGRAQLDLDLDWTPR